MIRDGMEELLMEDTGTKTMLQVGEVRTTEKRMATEEVDGEMRITRKRKLRTRLPKEPSRLLKFLEKIQPLLSMRKKKRNSLLQLKKKSTTRLFLSSRLKERMRRNSERKQDLQKTSRSIRRSKTRRERMTVTSQREQSSAGERSMSQSP
jgi:hypothetical protein